MRTAVAAVAPSTFAATAVHDLGVMATIPDSATWCSLRRVLVSTTVPRNVCRVSDRYPVPGH